MSVNEEKVITVESVYSLQHLIFRYLTEALIALRPILADVAPANISKGKEPMRSTTNHPYMKISTDRDRKIHRKIIVTFLLFTVDGIRTYVRMLVRKHDLKMIFTLQCCMEQTTLSIISALGEFLPS